MEGFEVIAVAEPTSKDEVHIRERHRGNRGLDGHLTTDRSQPSGETDTVHMVPVCHTVVLWLTRKYLARRCRSLAISLCCSWARDSASDTAERMAHSSS